MNARTDFPYAHARASGLFKFLFIQAALVSLAAGATASRWRQLEADEALPALRSEPLTVRPTYDFPVVVSDEQLSRVLTKLRPRNLGEKTKLNHVDHALRFWGVEPRFADPAFFSGEAMRGIVTDHRQFAKLFGTKVPSLLIDEPPGVRVRVQEGLASSSHVDHTLAGLAEVGTPLDFPLITPGQQTTYRAMVEQALRDFSLNQIEYEWTALTMALLLSGDGHWISKEGQEITFDRLVARLMREELPKGVCFGNHRLFTLAVILRIDERQPILDPHVRTQAIAFLMNTTARLVRTQNVEGYWDGGWATAPKATGGKDKADSHTAASGDPVGDRILATGHALEWWAMAPAQCLPPRETLAKAGQWLVHTIDGLTPEKTEGFYTYLSHAGRCLALWRAKLPHEVTLEN